MVSFGLHKDIKVCAGCLSVGDGVMLMAEQYGAAFMENGNRFTMFSEMN